MNVQPRLAVSREEALTDFVSPFVEGRFPAGNAGDGQAWLAVGGDEAQADFVSRSSNADFHPAWPSVQRQGLPSIPKQDMFVEFPRSS